MWKIIKEILIWVAIIAYLVISFSFSVKKEDEIRCKKVDVEITDKSNNYFIDKDDVFKIFTENKIQLNGSRLDSINISKLESLLAGHPSVKKAEVYKLNDGTVNVEIEQRNPIVRVINYNNESYYIDDTGMLMPLSENYTARVLVVNGNINEPFSRWKNTKVDSFNENNQTVEPRTRILSDIYNMGSFIHNSELWKSQIVQVYVDQNEEFELIPRIGNQVIIFGSIENMDKKFLKLEAVYKKGFNNLGWNIYKAINLKYENQVICTKR